MSKPEFRLQRVLDYRRHLADRAQLELAAVCARRARELAVLERLQGAERTTLAELGRLQRATSHAGRLAGLAEQLDLLMVRIRVQSTSLRRIDAEIESMQDGLIQLMQGVKVLEKLRERRTAEHAQEERRLERLAMADVAALQHRRSASV